jgi:AAA15 family ATPase/GTPase
MLKSLKIENFRCFKSFELQQLGRINLLVGANNSGKSSILEAIYLLTSPNLPRSISAVMSERSEYIFEGISSSNYELDFQHLFHGHEMNLDSKFSISNQIDKTLTVTVVEDLENSDFQTSGIFIELAMQGSDKF